jgi:hypothetical protein
MSNRTLSADAFFFQLGRGAALESWMAGGAMGEAVEELRKEGHVSEPQWMACRRFLEDLRRLHGSSAGIVPLYQERVQTSVRARSRPPGGGDPDAFARVTRVLNSLHPHERNTLGYLIVRKELPRGSLADFGRLYSAYKQNKTAKAFSTGVVQSLLASIACLYMQPS